MAPSNASNGFQEKPLCFVIGPYGERGSQTRQWSDFLFEKVVAPVLCDGYKVQRTIDSPESGQITGRIKRDLQNARIVIADLTADNPNVYYELGIRHVPAHIVEASEAMGASPTQILLDVELPLALHTIMAGVNQTLMMALSMVVVASMISVEGLGLLVLRGIGRLDMGLATLGGIGIVVLAMVLDRLTQAVARPAEPRGAARRGPVELARDLWRADKAR